MPGAYVFPGGVVHAQDFSHAWDKIVRGRDRLPDPPFPMYREPVEGVSDFHGRAKLAYRIAALRETFEEVGVLLPERALERRVSPAAVSEWQERVKKDAGAFRRFLAESANVSSLSLEPLLQWTDWLTPSDFTGRRFDTVFYFLFVNDEAMSSVVVDPAEVDSWGWFGPGEALSLMADQEKMWLAPPQVYELSLLREMSLGSETWDQFVEKVRCPRVGSVLISFVVKDHSVCRITAV